MKKYLPLLLLSATAFFCSGTLTAQWIQQCPPITGNGAVGQFQQGGAVAISPDGLTAVTSAFETDGSNSGFFVWRWQGGQWAQQTFINNIKSGGDISLAVSDNGNTIAAGNMLAGYIAVYVYENSNWRLQWTTSTNDNYTNYEAPLKALGLSYDGNTLLVQGRIYVRSNNVWALQANLMPTDRTVATTYACDSANRFSCLSTGALSADGNTAVVGDLYAPDTITNAWVFVRNGTTWSQQGPRLEGTNRSSTDIYMAGQVCISGDGNTFSIARPYDVFTNEFWVFTRAGSIWSQQGTGPLKTTFNDNYLDGANSISISYDGNTLLCDGADDYSFYYWKRTGNTWQQQSGTNTINFIDPHEVLGSWSGATPSLSLDSSGTRVLYGYDQFRYGLGNTFYFTLAGSNWVQSNERLYGTGASGGSLQGYSCALSRNGNMLAVGGEYDNGTEGAVWLFERYGAAWQQVMLKLQIADSVWQPRYFGNAISLSADGSTLAVGADRSNEDMYAEGSGSVFIYTKDKVAYKLPPVAINANTTQQFGYSVSLSDDGNTLLVGTGDSGAYVYVNAGNGWTQQAYFYDTATPYMGALVALSGDGNTAAISNFYSVNTKGSLNIYTRTDTTWTAQVKLLHAGNEIQGNSFPTSLAISQNGDVIAAGGSEEDHGYVFFRSGGVWAVGDSGLANYYDQPFYGLGIAVSSSGDTVAICGNESRAGYRGVDIYVRNGNQWPLAVALPDSVPSSNLLYSVRESLAASGDMSLIAQGFPYIYNVPAFNFNGAVRMLYLTTLRDTLVSLKPVTCLQNANGKIVVSVHGGTPPYNFAWSNGALNADSAINLSTGTYQLTISDAAGNEVVRQYTVPATDSIQNTDYITGYNCNTSTGYIGLSPTGGFRPYTYQWNTGPAQFTDTAAGITPGDYKYTVTDNHGCSYNGTAELNTTDYWSQITNTQPNCGNNGSAIIIMYGGVEPYTYLWNIGQHTSGIFTLGAGTYTATVTDAVGCSLTGTTTLTSDCDNVITGHVFFDGNNDCVQNNNEPSAPNLTMIATDGNIVAYGNTDANGNYEILVPSAGNFAVSIGHWQECAYNLCSAETYPVSVTLTGTGDTAVANFALLNSGIDLDISATYTQPNPGFDMDFRIYYSNLKDSVVPFGTVSLTFDSNLVFTSSNPPLSSFDPASNTITWNVYNISASTYIDLHFTVPVSERPGNPLFMEGSIHPTLSDCDTLNNYFNLIFPVTGSLDPNYKVAYPADSVGINDSILTYTVHFQNTGSAPTHYVEIKDTLSPNLDPANVRTVATSYQPYLFTISKNGILDWMFNPLALPDSTTDPIGSQAFVTYQVKVKPGLAIGTPITNSASVYFDYNTADQTNTVVNVVGLSGLPSGETVIIENVVRVFPNPFTTYTTFQPGDGITQYDINLTDVLGRNVASFHNLNSRGFRFNRGDLTAGCYLFKLSSANGMAAYGKLIVE